METVGLGLTTTRREAEPKRVLKTAVEALTRERLTCDHPLEKTEFLRCIGGIPPVQI
jgi:hypothetical protein